MYKVVNGLILSICIFLLANTIGKTQDTVSKARSFSIKINPLQVALTGEVRLLTEKFLNTNNSVELITSYFINHTFYLERNSKYFSFQNGFKTGIGFRHYFENGWRYLLIPESWIETKSKDCLKNKIYLNPLFFFKQMAYTNMREPTLFYSSERWEYYNYDSFTYSLQVHSGIVFGTKKFIGDGYMGLGVRYRHNIGSVVYKLDSSGIPYPTYSPYNSKLILPTIHFGINLGLGK